MHRLTPVFLLLGATTAVPAQSSPTIAATVPETDLVPEGIAWDPGSRSIFLSSTYRRKIVRVDSRGRTSDFVREGQDGLWGVIGMRVDPARGVLWAASSDAGMATLEQPTTAALVGDELLLVANSHLQTFRRLYETRPKGPWPELRPATVLRVSIR